MAAFARTIAGTASRNKAFGCTYEDEHEHNRSKAAAKPLAFGVTGDAVTVHLHFLFQYSEVQSVATSIVISYITRNNPLAPWLSRHQVVHVLAVHLLGRQARGIPGLVLHGRHGDQFPENREQDLCSR